MERGRPSGPVRPDTRHREQCEHAPRPAPEGEPAAVAPKCGRDRDVAPAAAGEEVDGGDEERQQHRHEHDLDRPPADDAVSEVDVARRPGRERDPLLERVDDVLGRPADLPQACGVQRVRLLPGPVGAGRDRHRRDAACDERRLLVRAEREPEVDELAEGARPSRLHVGLRRQLRADGLDEARRRGTGGVAGRPRGVAAPFPATASRSTTAMTSWRSGAWAANSAAPRPPSTAPSVERKRSEYGRVSRAAPPAGRVRPCELDERGRAGGVVVRAGAGSVVVAVGEDDDRLVGQPAASPPRGSTSWIRPRPGTTALKRCRAARRSRTA